VTNVSIIVLSVSTIILVLIVELVLSSKMNCVNHVFKIVQNVKSLMNVRFVMKTLDFNLMTNYNVYVTHISSEIGIQKNVLNVISIVLNAQ